MSILPSSFSGMSSEEKDKLSPSPNKPLTWLKPKQSEKQESTSITATGDPTTIDVKVAKPVGNHDDPNPVSFFGLFRYVLIFSLLHLRPLHTAPSPDSLLVQRSYSMPSLLLPQ